MRGLKLFFLLIIISSIINAQYVQPMGYLHYSFPHQVNIGNGIIKATHPSAALEIAGTNRGLLFPRLTTSQRNAIGSPAKGLYIFNTTTNRTNYFNGIIWIEIDPSANISITNIYNNSVVNSTLINGDSCAVISTGNNVNIDTFCFNFVICNRGFVNNSSFFACPCADTLNPGTTCDTVNFTPISLFVNQNWIRFSAPGITEFGSNSPSASPGLFLLRNTYTNTGYHKMFWAGYPIYDYPNNFSQQLQFANGTGIVSFLSLGTQLAGQPDVNNQVSLGINYTGGAYPASPSNLPGYMGVGRSQYLINTNGTGNGSFGFRADNPNAKVGGIGISVWDTANTEAVTIWGMPAPHTTYVGNITFGGTGFQNNRIAIFRNDKSVQFPGYLNNVFQISDSGRYKPAVIDTTDGTIKQGYWFGDGGDGIDTAANGLTDSLGRIILGGPLYKNTTINGDSSYLKLNSILSTDTLATLVVNNTALTNGVAIRAVGSNKGIFAIGQEAVHAEGSIYGVYGTTEFESGYGVFGTTNDALAGVFAHGGSQYGLIAETFSSFPGTYSSSKGGYGVQSVRIVGTGGTLDSAYEAFCVQVVRLNGDVADGVGAKMDFFSPTIGNDSRFSNKIVSKWSRAIDSACTSTLIISGVDSTTTVDVLTLSGNGSMKLRNITATQASAISATDGMIIYVSSTNGTFTSIGFWGRENGVWVKL